MLERATAVFRPTCTFQETMKPDSEGFERCPKRDRNLEATKAAVNQGVVPKISLSVSGWVGEQVTVTK